MPTLPAEIWQKIFALACTDGGLTGRSLSLVSKEFHDISIPVKYQSIAITRWRQLFAFSQTFSQLPDFQKKLKYLFIHCPYPFLDVEDNPRLANERCCLDNFGPEPVGRGHGFAFVHPGEDSDSDSDYSITKSGLVSVYPAENSDLDSDYSVIIKSDSLVSVYPAENSDLDSDYSVIKSDSLVSVHPVENSDSDSEYSVTELYNEFLDSDEEQEVLEDANYLRAVSKGLLPAKDKTREDEADGLDNDMQTVFDEAIQALHAILNETSSTLNVLTLYWTSFRPLPVHHILPPLPVLDELHLFRCSVVGEHVCDDSSTTPLFPRLRLLFMSGDEHHRSASRSVPKIAPNLTHFRFTICDLDANNRKYCTDILVKTSSKWATDQIGTLVGKKIDKSKFSHSILRYLGELPEAWHRLWSSRVAGRPEAWSTC